MSPDDARGLLSAAQEHSGLKDCCPSIREYAMLEELRFVRREAQAEANLAYADWRQYPSGGAFAVYLAAQDRADAAQDQLASWVRQITA
jgi:hypothetical protein